MVLDPRPLWRADPASWFKDVGLPLDLFDMVRHEASVDPCYSEESGEGRLFRIRIHVDAARRSRRWHFWAAQGLGFGFAMGVLVYVMLDVFPSRTPDDRIRFCVGVASGAVLGGVASVMLYLWLRSLLSVGRTIFIGVVAVMMMVIGSAMIGSELVIVFGSLVHIILLPGVLLGPIISESVSRLELRREHPNEFMLALTLGLLRKITAQSTVQTDPKDQSQMLWGLEELAGVIQHFRVTQPHVSDVGLQRRREQTADRRAEAVRQWMQDVLEPEQHPPAILAQKLRSVLTILLAQRWEALPQAIVTQERARPREWVAGIGAVASGLVLYLAVSYGLSIASDHARAELLAPVKAILPVIASVWIWLFMPPTIKRGLQTRIAGLKELRELR